MHPSCFLYSVITKHSKAKPCAYFLGYTVCQSHGCWALLCFVVVIHWLIFPYPSGLLHWHCGNLTIAPVPAKQPWWIWKNTSCEFIMNDCITTRKQSTTKPCAYFLGHTVFVWNCSDASSGYLFVCKYHSRHHHDCTLHIIASPQPTANINHYQNISIKLFYWQLDSLCHLLQSLIPGNVQACDRIIFSNAMLLHVAWPPIFNPTFYSSQDYMLWNIGQCTFTSIHVVWAQSSQLHHRSNYIRA